MNVDHIKPLHKRWEPAAQPAQPSDTLRLVQLGQRTNRKGLAGKGAASAPPPLEESEKNALTKVKTFLNPLPEAASVFAIPRPRLYRLAQERENGSMALTRDDELESFKSAIDLRAYASSRGYTWDKRESWRGSAVMRHANGDKIIIKRDVDQHYIYFSVRDERDNGSIIDFIQNRDRLSLGAVRKELRPWIGAPVPSSLPLFPALPVTGRNRLEVEAAFRQMQEALTHPYLENERALPSTLLASPRFAGRVCIDDYGNAVFPHFDLEGLCGYEIKNRGFTGFARGGIKGLWFSHREDTDTGLVIAESAIDALSHATLFPAQQARYASIGGQPNPRQPELLTAAIKRLPMRSEVVAAIDADEQGQSLSAIIHGAVARVAEETGRSDIAFRAHIPEGVKDWNDALRRGPFFPTALSSVLG
jgi:hypothetical protein